MSSLHTPYRRFSDAELLEFQAIVQAKILETTLLIKELKLALEDSNELSSGTSLQNPNNATDFQEKEYLFMMIARQTRYLTQLHAALGRIINKTYGICKITGELIDKRRLRIVPHTTMSVEAKMRR